MTVIEPIDPLKLNPDDWEPIAIEKPQVQVRGNQALTNEIVKHIFNDLGIYATRRISMHNDEFLTRHTLSFVDEKGLKQAVPIWGCQASINGTKFVMISTEFVNDREAVVLVQLEKCPLYGAYLKDECSIGVMIKDRWMNANIFLQASFLAGMEQMRDIATPFQGISNASELVKHMKAFIAMSEG